MNQGIKSFHVPAVSRKASIGFWFVDSTPCSFSKSEREEDEQETDEQETSRKQVRDVSWTITEMMRPTESSFK